MAADWPVSLGNIAVSFAFKEVLIPLAKGAIEDYSKDWLKDKISGAVADEHRQAVAKALKEFLGLLQDELEGAEEDLTIERIEIQFSGAVRQFICHPDVKEILGLAFGIDGNKIDPTRLAEIWTSERLIQLPNGFRWGKVVRSYRERVKAILLESNELRGLLDSQNLEEIRERTNDLAGIAPPNLEDASYRQAILNCYGYLRLNVLDSTDSLHRIRLWSAFIPQHVEEGTPKSRFDLPKSRQQSLLSRGEFSETTPMHGDFDIGEYSEKPPLLITDLLADRQCRYAVILGDPGSGKSSWFHYLALDWVEKFSSTDFIPIILELGKYKQDRSGSKNFLDFFHQSPNTFHKINRTNLDRYLKEGKVRVLFDGLDEIFDRQLRSEAIMEIIDFISQYPLAPVWITSRIIGYNPERLFHAGFRHFKIRDFNEEKIEEFIDKWYELAVTSQREQDKFSQRLKEAISHTPAIKELAGNPLLLTMMAILNLRQELPRDRVNLYEQASLVLLHSWDTEYHELNLIHDVLDRQDKQNLLKQIAYRMQSAPSGLAGNSISKEDLVLEISQFLQEREFDKPRQIAERLIEQLRARSFILCYVGAETYAFMHRTFLEYFCASYFVDLFEKQRKLTLEELIDRVYDLHWQNPTWHEVLRLMIARIDAEFAGQIIEWLINREDLYNECTNIFLAAECLLDVKDRFKISQIEGKILEILKQIAVDYDLDYYYDDSDSDLDTEIVDPIKSQSIDLILRLKIQQHRNLDLLEDLILWGVDRDIRIAIVDGFASGWEYPSLLNFQTALNDSVDRDYVIDFLIRRGLDLTLEYKEMPLAELKSIALDEDRDENLRSLALYRIVSKASEDPAIFSLIAKIVKSDPRELVRNAALSAIIKQYRQHPQIWEIVKSLAESDPHESVRSSAVGAISQEWAGDSTALTLILDIARTDSHKLVRCSAITAIIQGWESVDNLSSIVDIAKSDTHPEVRCAAMEAISKVCDREDPALLVLMEIARTDPDEFARRGAIWEIAREWKSSSMSLPFLFEIGATDPDNFVRGTAIFAIGNNWEKSDGILESIVEIVRSDAHEDIRRNAILGLVGHLNFNTTDIYPLLIDLACHEPNEFVRSEAVEVICDRLLDRSEILPLLISIVRSDDSELVRYYAIKGIIDSSEQEPDILSLLIDRAKVDIDGDIRALALKEITKNHRDFPARFELLCDLAVNDPFVREEQVQTNPRLVALYALSRQYRERPEVRQILLDRVANDPDLEVREFVSDELEKIL
jgi:hypothetical protein